MDDDVMMWVTLGLIFLGGYLFYRWEKKRERRLEEEHMAEHNARLAVWSEQAQQRRRNWENRQTSFPTQLSAQRAAKPGLASVPSSADPASDRRRSDATAILDHSD